MAAKCGEPVDRQQCTHTQVMVVHAAIVHSLFEGDVKGLTPFCLYQPQSALILHTLTTTQNMV